MEIRPNGEKKIYLEGVSFYAACCALLFIFSALLTIGAAFMADNFFLKILFMLVGIVLLFLVVLFLKEVLNPQPYIILSPKGISIHPMGSRTTHLFWNQIDTVIYKDTIFPLIKIITKDNKEYKLGLRYLYSEEIAEVERTCRNYIGNFLNPEVENFKKNYLDDSKISDIKISDEFSIYPKNRIIKFFVIVFLFLIPLILIGYSCFFTSGTNEVNKICYIIFSFLFWIYVFIHIKDCFTPVMVFKKETLSFYPLGKSKLTTLNWQNISKVFMGIKPVVIDNGDYLSMWIGNKFILSLLKGIVLPDNPKGLCLNIVIKKQKGYEISLRRIGVKDFQKIKQIFALHNLHIRQ